MSFEEIRASGARSTDPEPGPSMDRFKRVVSIFRATDEARDAKVTSDKKALPFATVLQLAILAVSIVYMVVEWRWNLKLVGAVFGGELDADAMHALVQEGRFLAAFGIVWALSRGLISKSNTAGSVMLGAVFVALGVVVAYKAIDRGYEAMVDMIPSPAANQLYKATVYRSMHYQDAGDGVDASLKDPVAAVLWPLRLLDPKGVQQIDVELLAKAGESAEAASRAAEALWPKLQQKLILLGRKDEILAAFDRQYAQYVEASRKLGSILPMGDRRIQDFRMLTGMNPNASATKEEFAKGLMGSHILNMRQLGEAFLISAEAEKDPVVYSIEGLTVRLSDLEGIKTQADFADKIAALAKQKAETTLETANAQTDASTRTAVAAAVLPPIAMALSAVAIVLNVGAVVGAVAAMTPGLRRIPALVWPLLAVILALVLPEAHPLPGLDASIKELGSQVPFGPVVVERLAAVENALLKFGVALMGLLP